MYALTELSRDTPYTIDELLQKPIEWITTVYSINEEVKLQDKIQGAKLIGMANRLDSDNLVVMERLFKIIPTVDDEGKPIFQDDIRVFEALGGTIEKIPKKKKVK